ncbi:MAG TPA: hypothetical protein PLV13_11130, partial [Ilumatobacteraceae bacterium]|nr:hypothetical protein [Ilumatobacteraceae bacterium]
MTTDDSPAPDAHPHTTRDRWLLAVALGATASSVIAFALQLIARGELQLRALAQIGMLLIDIFAHVAFRRDLPDFQLRMKHQQAQQFAAGIARRADDRDFHSASVGLTSTDSKS